MSTSALLVQDVQYGILSRIPDEAVKNDFLRREAAAIAAARKAGIKIIYVVVGFRRGYPDLHPQNRMLAPIADTGVLVAGDQSMTVHADVAPADDDVLITKRRVSSLTGTDLEVVLRSLGVKRLVLTGVSTSGVVLSTVRQAADLDYDVVVLEDLCLDVDPEVHRVLVEKVFPRQAKVESSEAWIASLEG